MIKQVKSRKGHTRQGETRQDETRQNKRRLDKTKQDRTRNNSGIIHYRATQYITLHWTTRDFTKIHLHLHPHPHLYQHLHLGKTAQHVTKLHYTWIHDNARIYSLLPWPMTPQQFREHVSNLEFYQKCILYALTCILTEANPHNCCIPHATRH